MRTRSGVFLSDRLQRVLVEFGCKANDSGPEATVNVGNFAAQEPTSQYVGRISNCTGGCKNAAPLGMSPPTSSDAFTRYCLGQIWHGSMTAFEDDPLQLYKSNGFLRRHVHRPHL